MDLGECLAGGTADEGPTLDIQGQYDSMVDMKRSAAVIEVNLS